VVVDAPVADMLSSRILGVKPIIKYAAQPPSVNVIPSSVAPDAPLSPPSPHPPLSPPAPHPPASSCRPPGLHCLSPVSLQLILCHLLKYLLIRTVTMLN